MAFRNQLINGVRWGSAAARNGRTEAKGRVVGFIPDSRGCVVLVYRNRRAFMVGMMGDRRYTYLYT